MTFKAEEKQLYLDFIERYYFAQWRTDPPYKSEYNASVELFLTPDCDLQCKYCYLNKFGDKLYSKNIRGVKKVVENTQLLFDYFTNNKLFPNIIEIFGGTIPISAYEEIFDIIYKYMNNVPVQKEFNILIPMNALFVRDERKVKMLIDWTKKISNINSTMHISYSFDGKYADPLSRPAKNKYFKYDDEFYERTKDFARIVHPGFHPMISPENIHVWRKNFDWFLEYISDTYNCDEKEALNSLYLLEVRNPNWQEKELLYLADFNYYMTKRIFDIYDGSPSQFVNEFLRTTALNWYTNFVGTIGRGIGCSIQSGMYIRMGDLSIVPCHRTSWPDYESGRFIVENNQIVGLEPVNPWTHLAIASFKAENGFVCSHCPINSLCSFYCLGANLEFNKNLFVPIPSVCRMEYYKIKSVINSFKLLGIWPAYYRYLESKDTGMPSLSKLRQAEALII